MITYQWYCCVARGGVEAGSQDGPFQAEDDMIRHMAGIMKQADVDFEPDDMIRHMMGTVKQEAADFEPDVDVFIATRLEFDDDAQPLWRDLVIGEQVQLQDRIIQLNDGKAAWHMVEPLPPGTMRRPHTVDAHTPPVQRLTPRRGAQLCEVCVYTPDMVVARMKELIDDTYAPAWRQAVADGTTMLGYADWLNLSLVEEASDDATDAL